MEMVERSSSAPAPMAARRGRSTSGRPFSFPNKWATESALHKRA